MGQLGNQMFQYASLKGIARNRGFDYMVANNEDPVVDSLGNRFYTELFNPFDLDVKQQHLLSCPSSPYKVLISHDGT